jgi:cell division protein ZapA
MGADTDLSDISDLTASLNKMKAAMKDVLSQVNKEADNVSSGMNAISDLVKHFETRVKDRGKIEEEKIKKKAQIEKEIFELEKKKSLTEDVIEEKTTNTSETTSKLEDLQRTLETTQNEAKEATKQVNDLERSISDRKKDLEKLKSELQSIQKKHEGDIQSLRKSHEEATSGLAWKDAQHKALALLMKEKAVSFPELRIIEALREQPTTNLENLASRTQLKPKDVESAVKDLAKKSVLQYDSKTRELRVLRPLDE